MTEIIINEIFGPTVQGEGPSTGRLARFIRLAGCNLGCVWCDSAYTWDWTGKNGVVHDRGQEIHRMTVERAVDILGDLAHGSPQLQSSMIVITGGEPLLQRQALNELITQLQTTQPGPRHIEIETAGTLQPYEDPTWAQLVSYNVSPKLENSGNALAQRYQPDVLNWFAASGRAAFKFVVQRPEDFTEIDNLVTQSHMPTERVYIMPEGSTRQQIEQRLQQPWFASNAIQRGYNLSTRLQIHIWNKRRAV